MMAMMRSRLKGRDREREISVRRQVGDAEGMVNEGWRGGVGEGGEGEL